MEFIHYNSTRKKLVIDPTYKSIISASDSWIHFKPQPCIWLSVGRAWKDFMADFSPEHKARYRFAHRVHVDTSKLIVIKSIRDLNAFEKLYGVKVKCEKYPDGGVTCWGGYQTLIDWAFVIHDNPDKSGILVLLEEIRGKIKVSSLRHKRSYWIITFDVDSAALWDSAALLDSVRF